ncbi:MAG: DEAD/DEAH box helicase [Lachnospiraceae bacterium]|nr:DEAD/DEAH box helicase [Lachnospiraceae bacterium]
MAEKRGNWTDLFNNMLQRADRKDDAESNGQKERSAGSTDQKDRSAGSTDQKDRSAGISDQKDPAAELLPALCELQGKEIDDHRKNEEGAVFVPSDYRYFHYDRFLSDIQSTAAARKRAREYIEREDPAVRVGFRYNEGWGTEELTGVATLSGESKKYYSDWTVRVSFDRDHITSSTCSEWGCRDARYYGTDSPACEHQLAAIYLLQEYLRAHNPGDATNLSGLHFLSEITGAKQEPDQNVTPSLSIVPYLTLEENGLSACFRTGAGKYYKIKDLNEFSETMKKGGQMRFGSRTELTLGREYLFPESEKWDSFIEDFLQNEKIQIGQFESRIKGSRYYNYEISRTKDRIVLEGQMLDKFFDAALGETIEFTDKTKGEKKKSQVTCGIRDLSVTLRIDLNRSKSGVIEGVLLTGDVPEMIKGIGHAYYISDGALNRVPDDRYALLRPIFEAEHGGYVRIMIGRAHLSDFYRRALPRLKTAARIESSPEVEAEIMTVLAPEPEFITYFDVDSGNIIGRCDVFYDSTRFLLTDHLTGNGNESFRYFEEERGMLGLLRQYLPKYDPQYRILFAPKEGDLVFDLLDRGIPEIMKHSEVRMTERFRALRIRKRVRMDIGLSVSDGLLDLTVRSTELTSDELLDILYSYRKKRKYVTLRNGDFFKLDENETVEELSEMLAAMNIPLKEFVAGKMHIPAYRALYLDKMMEESQDLYARRDSRFKSLIKEFKTVEDADFEVPETLRETLRRYQTVGYRWLRTLDVHHFGGILADDMGLGKTLQVITVLLAVRNENPEERRPSLIVSPASLVYNWKEEIRTFADSLKTVTVTGTRTERKKIIANREDADVLITSYDLLKRDITMYEDAQFRFLVADEAQYIKNYNTAAAKTLKLVHAETRYALTGTPIENRLTELWSIFDFLMPGLLYSFEKFRSEIETPIIKSGDEEARDRLRRMVTPFILRRKKSEVLKDLPEKLEELRYAHMEKKQQELYDGQVVRMRKKLQTVDEADFRKGKIEILAELTHIRQICCDPSLLFEDYDGQSAKKELCLELIDSLIDGEHRALIFSQFTTMLEKLEAELKKRGITYYKITGATPKERRVELVREFNEGTVPLFLISLKAGGTGLNLTGADVVIHYDPWWNLAVQNQATDRAHRIGQTKVVNVYKLIVKGTIEEKIVEMQESKRQLADDILQADGVSSASISREELLELLT